MTAVDLRRDQEVWLVPRTLAAPPICFTRPSAVVVSTESPYVVVRVKDETYRVHEDNVTRSDPNKPSRRRPPPPRPGAGSEVWEDVPLW